MTGRSGAHRLAPLCSAASTPPSSRTYRSRVAWKPKGVFCLEGDWWNDMNQSSTVRPILELAGAGASKKVPFVHRDVATREELEFYLRVWTQTRYRKFPILYLAFHGSPGEIHLSDGRKASAVVDLEWIETKLAGRCKGRVIHFGSCSTLSIDRRVLKRFLRVTGATAITGHREDTDWIRSAAFEVLLLDAFQYWSLTKAGARAVQRFIQRDVGQLGRSLGFRMEILEG